MSLCTKTTLNLFGAPKHILDQCSSREARDKQIKRIKFYLTRDDWERTRRCISCRNLSKFTNSQRPPFDLTRTQALCNTCVGEIMRACSKKRIFARKSISRYWVDADWPEGDRRHWSHHLRVVCRHGLLVLHMKRSLRLFATTSDFIGREGKWHWPNFHSDDYWATYRGVQHLWGGAFCHGNSAALRDALLQAYLTLIRRLENDSGFDFNRMDRGCGVLRPSPCVHCNTLTPCQHTRDIEKLACPVDGCGAEYYISLGLDLKWRRSLLTHHYVSVERYQNLGAIDGWHAMMGVSGNEKQQLLAFGGDGRQSLRMRYHSIVEPPTRSPRTSWVECSII